jgi:hypothetical protein
MTLPSLPLPIETPALPGLLPAASAPTVPGNTDGAVGAPTATFDSLLGESRPAQAANPGFPAPADAPSTVQTPVAPLVSCIQLPATQRSTSCGRCRPGAGRRRRGGFRRACLRGFRGAGGEDAGRSCRICHLSARPWPMGGDAPRRIRFANSPNRHFRGVLFRAHPGRSVGRAIQGGHPRRERRKLPQLVATLSARDSFYRQSRRGPAAARCKSGGGGGCRPRRASHADAHSGSCKPGVRPRNTSRQPHGIRVSRFRSSPAHARVRAGCLAAARARAA